MTSMRERIAKSMAVVDSGPVGSRLFDLHWDEFKDGYLGWADTILDALMEPTEGMISAASEVDGMNVGPEWRAMILAAKGGL